MSFIVDTIRLFLWGLAYALFAIGDAVYGVIMDVSTLNIGDLDLVWNWWIVLSLMIGGISTIRILILGIRYMVEEELQEKLDFFKIFGRVLMVSMAIALMPMGVRTIANAGQTFNANIGLVTGHSMDLKPSTLIISSVIGDAFEVQNENGGYEIPKTYTLQDIEINHKESGSDEYAYFKEMGDIFVLIIVGGIAIVGLIFTGIEVAERFFRLGIKILISPLPISGLVNPEDESFKKWVRLVIADIVLNSVQVMSLFFILAVASSNFIRSLGVWVTLIMFIGGIFAVLKGVPEAAPLIGGDSSTQGAMQQMAAIRQASRGMGSATKGAFTAIGATLGAGATLAGAGAGYQIGRALGGKSIAELSSSSSSKHQFSQNGNESNEFKSGGQEVRNQNHQNVETSSRMNMDQHNDQSLSAQSNAQGMGLNNDLSGTSTQSHSKESQEFKSGGQDPRYQQDSFKQNIHQNQTEGFARSGSFASNFAQKAFSEHGSNFAKVATGAGRHVYQKSMNRLNRSLPARTVAMVNRLKEPLNTFNDRSESK